MKFCTVVCSQKLKNEFVRGQNWCFVPNFHPRNAFLTLAVRLAVKKTPSSVFASLKNSMQNCAEPFYYFSWILMGRKTQQSDRRSVHRKLFGMTLDTDELFFETAEILRSSWLIEGNGFKVSILVILAAKAKFSTTTNWKKVSTNKRDIDGQPEVAMWPRNRKYLYLRKYDNVEIPTAIRDCRP